MEDGEETVDIWFDTECETMNIDNALYMLKELEVYSKQTNNVTHQHKAEVIALTSMEEIEVYDTSDKVNGFILNGQIVWLDKATRVGLMNSTTIERNLGQETTELWLGEHNLIIKCDLAIQLLQQLEVYALKCFNVTAAHKKSK